MLGFNKNNIIQEVKDTILKELVTDKEFKEEFKTALGIKDDLIILKGDGISVNVYPHKKIKND